MDTDQQAYQNFIESDQTLYTYYNTVEIYNTESMETLSTNTFADSSIQETNYGKVSVTNNNNSLSSITNDTADNNKLRFIADCTLGNAISKNELTSHSVQHIKRIPKTSLLSQRNMKTEDNGRKYSPKKSLSKRGNFRSSSLRPGTPAFQNSPSAKFFCGIIGSKEFPLPVGTPLEKKLTKESRRKCFAFSPKNELREPTFKTPESTTPSTPQNPSPSSSNEKSSSKKGHTANRDKIMKTQFLSQNLNNKEKIEKNTFTSTSNNQKSRSTKTKLAHETSNITSTETVINTVETLATEPVHTELTTKDMHSRVFDRIPTLKMESLDTEFVSIKTEPHSPKNTEDITPEVPATVSGLEERTNENVNKLIDLLQARYKQDYDETDLLFLSYAKSIKKLPRIRQAAIKFKIAQIFMEDELDNIESDDEVKCVNTDDPLHANKER